MTETKPFYLSKGVLGPLLSLIGTFLFAFSGVEFSADDQNLVIDQVDAIYSGVVILIGIVTGIYGRVTADKKISIPGKSGAIGMLFLIPMVAVSIGLTACTKYKFPDECQTEPSLIRELIPDDSLLATSALLQYTNLKMIQNDVYKKDDAQKVINTARKIVMAPDSTHSLLALFLDAAVKTLGQKYQMELLIAAEVFGPNFQNLNVDVPISPCDRILYLRFLDKAEQKLVFVE